MTKEPDATGGTEDKRHENTSRPKEMKVWEGDMETREYQIPALGKQPVPASVLYVIDPPPEPDPPPALPSMRPPKSHLASTKPSAPEAKAGNKATVEQQMVGLSRRFNETRESVFRMVDEYKKGVDKSFVTFSAEQGAAAKKLRKDVACTETEVWRVVGTLQDAVADKPGRVEVEELSKDVGRISGKIANINGAIDKLNKVNRGHVAATRTFHKSIGDCHGAIEVLEERTDALERRAKQTDHDLNLLRGADKKSDEHIEEGVKRARKFEKDLEEFKGEILGVQSTLEEVRAVGEAAHASSDKVLAEIAALRPHLKRIEALAGDMRELGALRSQVQVLEGWRTRLVGDVIDIARGGRNEELARELEEALPKVRQ